MVTSQKGLGDTTYWMGNYILHLLDMRKNNYDHYNYENLNFKFVV
jgi:hypothetical protein